VVQSYIQDLRPDVKLYQVPVADQYMIGAWTSASVHGGTNTRSAAGREGARWFAGIVRLHVRS